MDLFMYFVYWEFIVKGYFIILFGFMNNCVILNEMVIYFVKI